MHWLLDILRGAVIGVSNIIPGVSGGTMAVSMGIYDRLIGDITNLFRRFKQSVTDVLPIAIGVVVGIFAFSALIGSLLGVSVEWDADLSAAKLDAKRLTASDVVSAGLNEIALKHGDEQAALARTGDNAWQVTYQDGTVRTMTGSSLKAKRACGRYKAGFS